MPKQAGEQGKAMNGQAQGQEVQKNKRNTKKQDIEFFSNEKGPATCCGVLVFNS